MPRPAYGVLRCTESERVRSPRATLIPWVSAGSGHPCPPCDGQEATGAVQVQVPYHGQSFCCCCWVGLGGKARRASLITGCGVSGVPRGEHSSLAQPPIQPNSDTRQAQARLVWPGLVHGHRDPIPRCPEAVALEPWLRCRSYYVVGAGGYGQTWRKRAFLFG